MHYAVPAEAVGEEKTRHFGRFAENWVVVRRHFVESRPSTFRIDFDFSKTGTRSAARVKIFSMKLASKSVLNPGVSSGSFQASKNPRPSGRKWKPVDMSMIMGAECGNSSKGSVGTNMRRKGTTGNSMPTICATGAAHAPAQLTTVRVETCREWSATSKHRFHSARSP